MCGIPLVVACLTCAAHGFRVRFTGEQLQGHWRPHEKSEPLESLALLLLSSPNPTSGWQVAGFGIQGLQGARVNPSVLRMQSIASPAPVEIPDFVPSLAPDKVERVEEAREKDKMYKLILFDDDFNLREYVARVLCATITEISSAQAYQVMMKAHKSGSAVVGIWAFELAEAYNEGLKAKGLKATITEVDDT